MKGLRRTLGSRFGAALAGLSIALQLAMSSWGLVAFAAAGPDDALLPHALCLAAEQGAPAPPAGQGPAAPAHDHTAFCCLWHAQAGLEPAVAAASLPLAYARALRLAAGATAFSPAQPDRPANARAPPALT